MVATQRSPPVTSMTQHETRAFRKLAVVAGKATEIENPEISSDRGTEPNGDFIFHRNDEGHEEIPFNPIFEHHARQEQQLMPQAQKGLDQETQDSDIAVQEAQAELGCKFCSAIVASFHSVSSPGKRGRENVGHISLGQRQDILLSDCPHTAWFQNVESHPGFDPVYETREIFLGAGPTKRTWKIFVAVYETQLGSSAYGSVPFELVRRPEVPNHQGRGRILDESWIDFELVRDWRSRCILEHGGRCDKPAFGTGRPCRPSWLIDVVEGCVVPCEDECPRFLTLSYTWGKTNNFLAKKNNINHLRQAGALLTGPIFNNIPETIRNAIAFTKALGETRLWVDSLCIIQDDEAALLHDLRNMHRIYASSFLTIIAENGQDANFGLRGLRGLSSPRAADQKVLPMAAGEALLMIGSEHRNHQVSIYDYGERMWTFQERIFAKRRLLFTPFGTVKWQCNCAEWDEYLHYSPEHEVLPDDENIALGLKSRIPSLDTIDGVIRQFNEKNLTYDEDVLSAFAGIQSHLESFSPSSFLFGHSEIFFDISLCWFTWSNIRRRTVSEKFTGDPILSGLPSWSWMGWQGSTLLPRIGEYQPGLLGFTESVTKWHCVESPSSSLSRSIDSTWHDFRAHAAERQVDMDGWTCLEFEPPSRWHGDEPVEDHLDPCCMPKQLPKHIYLRHGFEEEGSKGLRWYPIPIRSEDVRPAGSRISRPQQFQFIRCETTRAFLTASSKVPLDTWEEGHRNPVCPLVDDSGNTVGALLLHHLQDHLLFAEGRKVEVVAIVKGWTILLNEDSSWPTECQPWISEWEQRKQQKEDCIFVLWITWDRGIAYRKAFGYVRSEDWEELKETENIDLILG